VNEVMKAAGGDVERAEVCSKAYVVDELLHLRRWSSSGGEGGEGEAGGAQGSGRCCSRSSFVSQGQPPPGRGYFRPNLNFRKVKMRGEAVVV
jgi:hypothetical protein